MLAALKRLIKRAFRPALSVACDNLGLQLLRSFDFGYLPWTAASLRPATLCAVLNEIIINKRRSIVEFGSGVSTFYLGRLLAQRGGRLVSIEHNESWYELLKTLLIEHNLADAVTLVHAPLKECSRSPWGMKWYDEAVVLEQLKGVAVDGVLVDGPPASSENNSRSRYPAVPVLESFLAPEFFCCLDDIGRPGEAEVFTRWQSELNLVGKIETVAGSYGIIRRGGHFGTSIAAVD